MSTTTQISCPQCRATPLILLSPVDDDAGPIKWRHGICYHCGKQVKRIKKDTDQPLPQPEWRHKDTHHT